MTDQRRCAACGLVLADDTISVAGRSFHARCALSPERPTADSKRRRFLRRLAHWGNSVGWGQST